MEELANDVDQHIRENRPTAGGWYLDLIDMEFTVVAKDCYDLHGVPRKQKVTYEWYLENLVYHKDRTLIEQTRLSMMSGLSEKFIRYRCIDHQTGKIQWLTDLVVPVHMGQKLVGLRGRTNFDGYYEEE